MSTMPMSQQGQPGQTGLPGNTPTNTMPMNYSFMPHSAAAGSTGPGTTNSTIPTYTANNFSTTNPTNPFSAYTGFNLGLNSADELTKMYGPLGTAMYYYLNNGAGYNPAVLTSLVNQIQPQVQSGLATLGSTAGMTGNRFGSAYQIGSADYLSQVNQNELGMASNLYQQSQSTLNNDLLSLLPGAGQFQSNKGGFTSSLISSLLPALLNPNSTLGGSLASLINLIPGINIPTGGTGGGSGGGIGGIGGTGSTGGVSTTPSTFPNSPTLTTIEQMPTQGSAGNATAGATIDANTGQTTSASDTVNQMNMRQLMELLWSMTPGGGGGGGSDVPYDPYTLPSVVA